MVMEVARFGEVYPHACDTLSGARAGVSRYFTFYTAPWPNTVLDRCTPDAVYFGSLPIARAIQTGRQLTERDLPFRSVGPLILDSW